MLLLEPTFTLLVRNCLASDPYCPSTSTQTDSWLALFCRKTGHSLWVNHPPLTLPLLHSNHLILGGIYLKALKLLRSLEPLLATSTNLLLQTHPPYFCQDVFGFLLRNTPKNYQSYL